MITRENLRLESVVTDQLLKFFYDAMEYYEEMTTSDFQAVAQVVARDIISKVQEKR